MKSQCKLGALHRIAEIHNTELWELSRWHKSNLNTPEETLELESIDEIIDSIAAIETKWRKNGQSSPQIKVKAVILD